MNLNLSDNDLKNIASEAILRAIDQKSRDDIIRQAIEYLIKPDSYGGKTPLERSFQAACYATCMEICRQQISESEEIKGKISSLVSAAVQKLFTERADVLVTKMANALESVFDSN